MCGIGYTSILDLQTSKIKKYKNYWKLPNLVSKFNNNLIIAKKIIKKKNN